jgi:hypothetical protein
MIKLPDGRFLDRWEVFYADEAAALARFRELDRIRQGVTAKAAASA